MDRVFNQEIKLTLKPKEIDKNLFMKQANEIERKIKQIIYEKFNTTVNIDSRMKFGIDYFLEKFKEDKNFSFVKYGDGELLCMIGAKGENCDFHPYSTELGELLKSSFGNLLAYDEVYLADWKDNLIDIRDMFIKSNNLKPKFADYDCFLTIRDNIKDSRLLDFYTQIKKSKRKKIFVGPKHLRKMKEMLNLDEYIVVPSINAFSEYKRIKEKLVSNIENDTIYIFCCSMMSCVLCNDLISKNRDITLLDIGSGFDPIHIEKTRPKQPSMQETHKYYSSILPEDIIRSKEQIAMNILSKNSGMI